MNLEKEQKAGLFYGLFTFIFWGIVPIYFKAVSSTPSYEVLLHRIVWSVVFLSFILLLKKDFTKALVLAKNKRVAKYLLASSIVIAFNWLTFIWAIEHNQIIETSLGYYINPLVTITFGILFLKEKPTFYQKIAIAIAFFAVCYQLYMLGSFPMVSIILAITFPIYGLLRKKVNLGSLVGLFIETLFLLPIALLFWFYLFITNHNHFSFTNDPNLAFLLMLAGVVTVLPLLAFNSAATRLKLSTIGYLQYISPSVSMLLAVFLYNEPLTKEKLITFSLIWIALFIVSLDTLKLKTKDKIK